MQVKARAAAQPSQSVCTDPTAKRLQTRLINTGVTLLLFAVSPGSYRIFMACGVKQHADTCITNAAIWKFIHTSTTDLK